MSLKFETLQGTFGEKADKYFGIEGSLVEVTPSKCLMPPQYKDIGDKILDAEVRDDDVWLISYPRTGMYFLLYVLDKACKIITLVDVSS